MNTQDIMALADKFASLDGDARVAHIVGASGSVLVDDAKQAKAALQSAIEALQADAERYRWLRDPNSDSTWLFSPGSYDARYGLVDLGDMLSESELDASIDAAMASQAQEK